MRIILCCGERGQAIVVGEVLAEPVAGQPVELRDARMVLRWHEDCGGLFGLAARGPRDEWTRITRSVPRVVETVWQEWVEVTPVAAEEIDRWPAY